MSFHSKMTLRFLIGTNVLVLVYRKIQQRLPYDLLTSLASSLLDGTVFEIVNSLKEVQQLEERHLSAQRMKILNEHKGQLSVKY